MTVKELQNKLNDFPGHLEVYCEGFLIVKVLGGFDAEDEYEYVELEQDEL